MKLDSVIFGTALLLSGARAANPRYAEQRAQAVERRNARRSAMYSSSTLSSDLTAQEGKIYTSSGTNDRPGGWGGAVVTDQTGVSNVKATFQVPHPQKPKGGSAHTKYGGAAWVGIDGFGASELWQTGITWTIENGHPGFSAWYEWVPGPYTSFGRNLTVRAGDTVTLEVVASSATAGTAYVVNESTGQRVQQQLHGQVALPRATAEWIVEDFQSGSEPVAFAAFHPAVSFRGAQYATAAGMFALQAGGATMLEIGQDQDTPFTDCEIGSAGSLTCSRVKGQM